MRGVGRGRLDGGAGGRADGPDDPPVVVGRRGREHPVAAQAADRPGPTAAVGRVGRDRQDRRRAGAVAPGAPAVKLVREGTHVTQRVGRLDHTPDGTTAVFTFDADGAAMKDPPMIILQNLALEQMEATQVNQSRDTRFRVSGTVTEYKGRNYVLLDTATAVPDVDANF